MGFLAVIQVIELSKGLDNILISLSHGETPRDERGRKVPAGIRAMIRRRGVTCSGWRRNQEWKTFFDVSKVSDYFLEGHDIAAKRKRPREVILRIKNPLT